MFQNLKTFVRILFIGNQPLMHNEQVRSPILSQYLNVKKIWNNRHYEDFGLERLIRLSLALSQFIFPGLYFKAFFNKFGLAVRKLAVEFYVVLKLLLPLLLFKLKLTGYLWAAVVSGVMGIETIVYLAALIYLSNESVKPVSYRRSLTALFINYMEICLDYAVIYSYCNINIPHFFKEKLTSGMQVIYFSFSTSATVGYGDIVPLKSFGQELVITQIIVFLVFVGLFINFFTAKIQDPTYRDNDLTSRDIKEEEARKIEE